MQKIRDILLQKVKSDNILLSYCIIIIVKNIFRDQTLSVIS